MLVGTASAGLLEIGKSDKGLRRVYKERTVPLVQISEIIGLMSENIRALYLAGMSHVGKSASRMSIRLQAILI